MRRPMMAGNWKMYKTPAETHTFFEKFNPLVVDADHCEIVICPLHQHVFELATGCSRTGQPPLRTYRVRARDSHIILGGGDS
jgi:triosephosphate isomerase